MRRKTGAARLPSLLAAASLLALSAGAAPAPAAPPGMRIAANWTYETPDDVDTGADIPGGSLILNPNARRAFQFFELNGNRTLIRILDLDTMATLAEAEAPMLFLASRGYPLTQYIHALDPDTNTLYLPYNSPGGISIDGVAVISGTTGEIVKRHSRSAAVDPSRVVTVSETPPNGPEDVAVCTSQACQPQTFGGAPKVDGMEFIPSFVSGSKPKILMLWHDVAVATTEGNVYVVWATQWDAETGKQDFSYKIQGCSVILPGGSAAQYALSIFQARLGAGIYVGCNGPSLTGQVVRIRLDSNGQPSGEDTYPGPLGVADVFMDRNTDRLLFRVVTADGEAYWVFNGRSSTYTGVMGATLTNGATTRTGIDEANGRIYIMAPGTSKGNQSQPSALLTADFRLAPAPQMTVHPELYVPNVDLQLQIDTEHPSGKKRIFAHVAETNRYVIIEDGVPPTLDDLVTDQDRFTVDREEEEGETDANFTGTGHSYGLRALFAGGAQGLLPSTEVGGVSMRLVANDYVRSPCQSPDREVRLGSVPYATLGNSLASAEAAAASTEVGTVADLREPTGRCEPLGPKATPPLPEVAGEDDDDDGQSDVDETLGNEWPFFAALCSGDDDAENVTTLKPLDRRPIPDAGPSEAPKTDTPLDDVLSHPRDTSLALEDNRAAVDCGQSEQTTEGAARSGALDVDGLPPNIETMTVGSVGSFTKMYRKMGLGLVTETVAFSRNISIGDRISIDVAYSRAVAWAGGRPGTAGTSLERRICGVSVPEIGGRYDVIPIDTPVGEAPPDPDPVFVGDPAYDLTKGITNPTDGSDGISQPIGNVDPLNHDSDDLNVPGAVAACAETPVAQANGTTLGPRPFLEILNRVLGARGRAYIPEPDSELSQGSPGGYLASIQKDRYQQIGARAVSNDGSTQVPALEIQLYNDDYKFGRGRQLFQFAGVDASVTYGIYLLNPLCLECGTDFPGDPIGPGDITDDLIDYTGGPSIGPMPNYPTEPSAPPITGVFAPVTYIYRGISFLARSWQDAALAGAVLILLAGPLVLLGRRRALRTLA